MKIHQSNAQKKTVLCGRRFGKTLLAAREAEAVLVNHNLPNQRIWVVAPDHAGVDKIFREVWADVIRGRIDKDTGVKYPPLLHPRQIVKKMWNPQDRIIRTAWGSEIIGKTAKNKESLIGDEVDLLIFDEAAKCKESIWTKYLSATLIDRKGRAIFITTPEGTNWCYRAYLDGQSSDKPDWDSFNYTSYDNEYADFEEIEKMKRDLPENVFRQEYLADPFSLVGQVYSEFDDSVHVLKRSELPESYDSYIVGVDYGFANPSVILLIGIKKGRYYVIKEHYETEMFNTDIKNVLTNIRKECKFSYIYADHDPAINKYLGMNGFQVIKAKKDVKAGIEEVATLLVTQKDDKPLLFISEGCKHLLEEMKLYRYPDKKSNNNIKEEPIKEDDHCCDALRYAVYTHRKKSAISLGRGLY